MGHFPTSVTRAGRKVLISLSWPRQYLNLTSWIFALSFDAGRLDAVSATLAYSCVAALWVATLQLRAAHETLCVASAMKRG